MGLKISDAFLFGVLRFSVKAANVKGSSTLSKGRTGVREAPCTDSISLMPLRGSRRG